MVLQIGMRPSTGGPLPLAEGGMLGMLRMISQDDTGYEDSSDEEVEDCFVEPEPPIELQYKTLHQIKQVKGKLQHRFTDDSVWNNYKHL